MVTQRITINAQPITVNGHILKPYAGLNHVVLNGASIARVQLMHSHLHSAKFCKADISHGDFSSAQMDRSWLAHSKAEHCNFSRVSAMDADFSGACLLGANFRGADLRRASFSGADLCNAKFDGANLEGANFDGATLWGANFRGANLEGANLNLTNLEHVTGNGKEVHSLTTPYYPVTITLSHMQIGCKKHLIDTWFHLTDEEIDEMDTDALTFWAVYKPILKGLIEAHGIKIK